MEGNYNTLAGGVSAWGLGREGARGGFGSGGVLGKVGAVASGPFLLLVDGVSRLLLVNATDRLLITGTNPASGSVPTYYILGF